MSPWCLYNELTWLHVLPSCPGASIQVRESRASVIDLMALFNTHGAGEVRCRTLSIGAFVSPMTYGGHLVIHR